MADYVEKRVLPYARQKLFDIVADVERYPEFLPGWIDAQVLTRGKDHMLVQQTLGIGPVHIRFCSQAEYCSPEAIAIRATGGPFHHLEIAWHFQAIGESAAEVTLEVAVRLKRVFFRQLLESWFSASTSSILSAFEQRARQLYAAESRE